METYIVAGMLNANRSRPTESCKNAAQQADKGHVAPND